MPNEITHQPRNIRVASLVFLLAVAVADTSAATEKQFSAGFVALPLSAQAPPLGLWYPSTSEETAGELGPFRPVWAWGGEAAGGVFPLIILSHGRTGRYHNHRHTAATLARHGFIVVAPDHLADKQMDSIKDIAPVVRVRVDEMKRALAAVHAHPRIGKIADTRRVGALGYSLGTLSALYAAGAVPEMSRFKRHCEEHSKQDPNFCGGGWLSAFFASVKSALSWLKDKGMLKPRNSNRAGVDNEFPPVEQPIDFSAIALVAPVGAFFSADALRRQDADIALFRLGDDAQLRYPHHAEHLYTLLGDKAQVYKTFDGVHHYAFISPFPQRLLEEADIPVANDPEGFDRIGFIREINTDIVNFFNRYLRYP